jgi:hypothetical protein
MELGDQIINSQIDQVESGTFVGLSQKGNGYIFLVTRTKTIVEIDSKDAKFNETFDECRERKGKLSNGRNIESELTIEREQHEPSPMEINLENDNEESRYSLRSRPTRQTQHFLPETQTNQAPIKVN